jgi:hypothetical protein
MKKLLVYSSALLFGFFGKFSVKAQAMIELEGGVAFTGYNDVRIPGNGAALFSLKNDLEPEPTAFYRLRAGYTIRGRHSISALYAPLTIKSSGVPAIGLDFAGKNFPADTRVEASYKFNSYRLTYRYDFVRRSKFVLGLGLTGKIRDASIRLNSSSVAAEKTNVGFVPLVNFRLAWQFSDKVGLLLHGDALAATQGRAEDVLLAFTYQHGPRLGIFAGYRILEGGADNDEVYNFALIHYASVGIAYTFIRSKARE